MTAITTKTKTRNLLHPILEVPSTAVEVGYWKDGGRVRGLELQFPDGHRARLTYDDISELQDRLDDFEDSEPDGPVTIFYQNTVQTVPDLQAAAAKLEKLYKARIKASARNESGREVGRVFENDGKLIWVCE